MIDIPCVIFAGGKSSRMGRDKTLLPFNTYKSLTHYQYEKLSQIFKDVYISCKDSKKFGFDANFIVEDEDIYAPTIGFINIFQNLKVDRFFVISVDTPFISKGEILKILTGDKPQNDATVASLHKKMQPMCGIYHRSLEKEFIKMVKEDNHKLGYLLKNSKTTFIDFEDEELFFNINTPDEYQKALAKL